MALPPDAAYDAAILSAKLVMLIADVSATLVDMGVPPEVADQLAIIYVQNKLDQHFQNQEPTT